MPQSIRLRRLTLAEEKLKQSIIEVSPFFPFSLFFNTCKIQQRYSLSFSPPPQCCEYSCDHLILPAAGAIASQTVASLVSEAADDAILIKKHLERARNFNRPISILPGGAREYLRNLETFPADVKTFLRELVHALYRNSNGYVVPVTMEDIDARLDTLIEAKGTEVAKERRELEVVEATLKETWLKANNKAKEVFALIDECVYPGPEYVSTLTRVFSSVHDINEQLSRFHTILLNLPWQQREAEYGTPEEQPRRQQQRSGEWEESEAEVVPEGPYNITVTTLEFVIPEEGEETVFVDAETENEKSRNDAAIRRIASEVGNVQERVQRLSSDIEVLNVEDMATKPEEAKETLKNVRSDDSTNKHQQPKQHPISSSFFFSSALALAPIALF